MGTEPVEIDITHELSAEQVDSLFAAFNDEDWAEVDRLIDGFPTGPDTAGEGKAGGADRNRGQAEVLRRYWTVGAGGQKIRWGTPGDWRRCVALLSEHLGPRAAGYCFTGDTEFLTRDGVMTFEDAVGTTQLVLTYDDPTRAGSTKRGKPVNKNKPVNYAGRWVEAPIQYYGEQSVLEVVLSRNGVLKTIKATHEHLWFASADGRTTRRGTASAVRTDALSKGMALAAVFPKAAMTRSTVSRVGVMAGFIYGDGHTQRRRGAFADLWGDKDAALLPYFDGCPSYPVKHDGLLGTRVYGMPAAFKDAPTLEEGVPYLMGWLAGYIAADGSVSANGATVTISSASRESLGLVRDVATLLGIGTYGVTETSRIGTGQGETPLYKVAFVADTMVADLLLIPEHRRRFAEYEARRGQGGTAGSPVRWTVVAVEDKGEVAPVYCAEVLGTENFALADNIWVHNCNLRHKEVNGFYPGDKRNLGKSLVGDSDHGFEYHTTKDDTGDSMLEFKTLGLQGVDVVSEEKGIVETIVSVTGVVDTVKDRIRPGAYVKSLTQRTPKGVWGHEWTTPVSRTLGAKELMPGDPELPSTMPNGDPWPPEAGALKIKTQFNLETQRGREAYSDVVFFGADSEWCVDEQTEILTARGWLRYDQLETDDQAYVLDPAYATGHFEPIQAVNVFPAKERQMRHIRTGGFSSLTTADHRWPLVSNHNGGHVRWATTKELRRQDRIFRVAGRADAPVEPKWSDAFVELVGWFWTEGWVNDNALHIGQSVAVNPAHVSSIRYALDTAFPGQWAERHSKDDIATFRLHQAATAVVLSVTGQDKAPTPEFLTQLTRAQLRLLVDTCMSGDGHTRPSGQATWYQVSDNGVAAFQMLCALAGVPTVSRPQKDYGNRYGRPPQQVSLLKNGTAGPLAAIAAKTYNSKPRKTPAVDELVRHDGIVWCPTTPSGTWMARREGTVYFTGNSVGYQVPVGGATVDSKTGIREIEVMDLYEYSPVLFGAMPLARTTSVKQAQLAYKALKGGAAPWLADAEVKEQPLPDATLSDGDDGYLPVDQMILVKRAITTLTDLLSVVRGDVEMKEGPREEEPDEPEEDYDSLAAALEDLITDDDELNATLVEAAVPVDDAIDSGDVEALDSASTTFLDAVETEMNREDADKTLLSDLLVLFADMVENLPTPEPPSEENQETKRQYDQSARDEMAESGAAMPDGSFPIKDEADLRNAIQAVGRAKDPDAAKAHIKKRAKALGLEDLIPDSWTDSKVLLNTEEIAEFVRDSE